jgi:hypothetical protein
MKRLLFLHFLLLTSLVGFNQAASPDKNISVLQQVINDVRYDFSHIKSKTIKPGIFESKQVMPGAQSSIVRVSSDQKLAEWVASFKPYEEKEKAEAEFSEISKSLSNAIIKSNGQPYILNAGRSACTKNQQLECTEFHLLPEKSSNPRLRIILSLVQLNGKYLVELVVMNSK